MLDVEVLGQIKQKQKVQLLCINVLSDLMPRLKRNVDVTVQFVTACEYQEGGFCIGDKNEVYITVGKQSMDIPYTFDEIMITLCHELVHAKQCIKGELKDGCIWKGVDMKHLPVSKHPWEKEAYSLEKHLYEKYKQQF